MILGFIIRVLLGILLMAIFQINKDTDNEIIKENLRNRNMNLLIEKGELIRKINKLTEKNKCIDLESEEK